MLYLAFTASERSFDFRAVLENKCDLSILVDDGFFNHHRPDGVVPVVHHFQLFIEGVNVSVDCSFDCCGGLRDINKVIGMVDQSSFFKHIFGWDITISLDFLSKGRLED